MTTCYVVFSHGHESGPWGRKISALAEVARSEGYETESVDYRGIDAPRERITRLADFCKELQGDLVLVGSSLGGYVAVASEYRALAELPGITEAVVFEPQPEEVYTWTR